MSNEIIEALELLSEKWGLAIDWTSKNVVPYLQELMARVIKYELITSVFHLILGVALVASMKAWLKLIAYFRKKEEEDAWGDYEVSRTFSTIGMVTCIVLGVVIILCQLEDITKCVILPETIFLRYLKNYM